MMTQALLKELMDYNPEEGKLYWKFDVNPRAKAGQEAGSLGGTNRLYLYATYRRIKYAIHHLIWLWETGELPKQEIDHINGNPRDNRFCNLRDVSKQVNMLNSYRSRKDTCGVYYQDDTGKYRVILSVAGKLKSHGSFKTKEEAVAKALEIKASR